MASRLPEVLLDHVVGRGLQDHLQLRVLVEAVGIFAVAAVGGTAAGLHVGDAVGLRARARGERFRGTWCRRPTSTSYGSWMMQPRSAQYCFSLKMIS